jgi:hypothetical protein
MAPPGPKRKPTGRPTIQETSSPEELSMPLSANNLTLDLPADLTPKTVTQTLPGPVTNIESEVDL